jgi:hypothetical protein
LHGRPMIAVGCILRLKRASPSERVETARRVRRSVARHLQVRAHTPGPHAAAYGRTSLVRITISLSPGPPPNFYVLSTFPNLAGTPPPPPAH